MFLNEVLDFNADRTPEGIALITGDRSFTYQEVRERVNSLARALPTIAERGDRVGILSKNVKEYVDALYGVPAAGMILTLLNQRLHPTEWAAIARDAGLRVILVHDEYAAALRAVADEIPSLEHIVVIGDTGSGDGLSYDSLVASGPATAEDARGSDDDVAWIVYTSGTTGTPKGVMLSHRGLMMGGLAIIIEYGARPGDRTLFTMPLCHAGANSVVMTHTQAGTFVLDSEFEPRAFLKTIQDHRITSTTLVPTMINMVLNHPDIDNFDLSSLVHFGYGGSVMPVELLKAAIDRFGPILASGLGMSEAPGPVLSLTKEDHLRACNGEANLLQSCGKPTFIVHTKVVDDDMVECPPGEVGEIVVRGDLLFKGYWNNSAGTEDAFRDRWYRTGDMARRDDEGFFFLVDRRKDMIISGGENVYSAEVERAIYECPQVSEVAVIGAPHPIWVETVVALVVPKAGDTLTEQDITAWCRDRLAGYKCPRIVEIRDELPKGSSGKILKHQLRREWADRDEAV
jgi:acyl-CoA synthetase (AMP-forming)/AMP-acid ligase II